MKTKHDADIESKVMLGRVAGAIRAIGETRGLSLQWARWLRESMSILTLVSGRDMLV